MADHSIFREAAVERLSTPDRLDQGLSIVGRRSWVLLTTLSTLILGGLIWGIVLKIPVTVRGQGILLAPGGVLDVTSESPGRLMRFAINVGDHIDAGAIVALLDQPDLRQDLATAEAERRDAVAEHDQIVAFQKHRAEVLQASVAQRRQSFQDELAFLEKRLKDLQDRAAAIDELAAKNIVTREKVLDSRLDIGKAQEEQYQAQNGLRNLDVEISRAEVDDQRDRLNSELKIAAADRKIASLRQRLEHEMVVSSPYEGVVGELKVNPGELVERNAPLFSLLPSQKAISAHAAAASTGPLYAVIYVPPGDGKKVQPGMAVRIAPSTVRHEEFGFMQGRVRAVSEIPSTVEGMNRTLKNRQLVQTLDQNGAPFEVVVDLFADPKTRSGYRWSSSGGPAVRIDAGTLASADVDVESIPILGLVMPPLRRLLGGGA